MSHCEKGTMATGLGADITIQIVESIFATMMDLEVCAIDVQWRPAEDRLTSSVDLRGDWNGSVSVECNRQQACQFAGKFLSMDPPDAVDDDVRDVLGELANMIGGNIKSVISADTRLSTPSIFEGVHSRLRTCRPGCQDEIALNFSGGTFWVTVVREDCFSQGSMSGRQ